MVVQVGGVAAAAEVCRARAEHDLGQACVGVQGRQCLGVYGKQEWLEEEWQQQQRSVVPARSRTRGAGLMEQGSWSRIPGAGLVEHDSWIRRRGNIVGMAG